MDMQRRHFLKMAGCGFGAAGLTSMMERLSVATAMAAPGGGPYQALVCVFLSGGNDGNNMIIPIDNYAAYSAVRAGPQLAIPQNQLGPTTISTSIGNFAMHPKFGVTGSMGELPLYPLFAQGKLAVVTNVGTLVGPMTRDQYQHGGGPPRPYQLFSHSDQQEIWQTSIANVRSRTGWGGRIADNLTVGNPTLPMSISPAGFPIFFSANSTNPLVISPHPTLLRNILTLSGFGTAADERARLASLNNYLNIDQTNSLVQAYSNTVIQTNNIASTLNVNPDPSFSTVIWPNSGIANQLYQIAKVIKLTVTSSPPLANKQIFFANLGGFDTHTNELTSHNNLYTQLSQAMAAFYQATVELGIDSQVVTFTISDFGRTFQPTGSGSGTVGSDHGWGNHALVMGTAVHGGDFYGVPRDPTDPTTIFPTLQLNGPSDTDSGGGARGRWIPTASVDQYGATLAQWFGLTDPTMLAAVFPNLANFATNNLGFV